MPGDHLLLQRCSTVNSASEGGAQARGGGGVACQGIGSLALVTGQIPTTVRTVDSAMSCFLQFLIQQSLTPKGSERHWACEPGGARHTLPDGQSIDAGPFSRQVPEAWLLAAESGVQEGAESPTLCGGRLSVSDVGSSDLRGMPLATGPCPLIWFVSKLYRTPSHTEQC